MGKYILGIGGANFDIHVKAPGSYNLKDSNPAVFETSAGGVCRNITENLARLGMPCKMITAVGKDAFGDGIIKSMENVGIGTEAVYKTADFSSSSYIDFLDGSGEMYVAACDAGILENMPVSWIEEHRELIEGATAIVIDTNLTEAQIEAVLRFSGDIPVYADPVSTAKSLRLKGVLGQLFMIKPNALELEALSGMSCSDEDGIKKATGKLISAGCKVVVTSLGLRGCYYADAKGKTFFAEPKKVVKMENCTGAGDAFTAGFISQNIKSREPENCVDFAQMTGAVAAESKDTISKLISEEYINSLIKE